MATIPNVTTGSLIQSARENASTTEVNDSVKMSNSGTQSIAGTLNVATDLLVRSSPVLAKGAFGREIRAMVACTNAEFSANTKRTDTVYFVY